MKKIASLNFLFALFAVVLLQGCATALFSTAPVTSTVSAQEDIARDVVRAIGYPTDGDRGINGLILLGDEFTYWITDGHEKIELVIKELNPSYINMESETTIEVKDDKFKGRLNFTYDRSDVEYSQPETTALNKVCSKETVPGKLFGFGKYVYYRCWIYVSGSLYSGRKSEFLEKANLSKGRSVRLISKEEPITVVDHRKVSNKLSALPFAIAFDLITLPVQVFFIRARQVAR